MQQHVFDDGIGALAVLHDLFEVAVQHVHELVDLGTRFVVELHAPCSASRNSSMSSTETAEKLLTKLSGFLISWAMPAVNWPSEASFSVCTRRSCAVRKSSSDPLSSRGARLHLVEQPHVLDRDHRLVGEGGDQLDLLVGERPHRCSDQRHDADWDAFAHERDAEHGTNAAEFLHASERIFGISMNVMNMNRLSFQQRPADAGTSPGFLSQILQQLLMLGRRFDATLKSRIHRLSDPKC